MGIFLYTHSASFVSVSPKSLKNKLTGNLMRNAFKAVLPFAAIALSGCSSPQIKSIDFGLIVANSSDVKSCLLISDVHGVSGLYGVFADTGLQKARLQAMAQASELGASHIVWTDFEVVYGSTTAHANAYLCPTTESASEPEKGPQTHSA
tara:strand:+ start:169 stop:618 length:450 start_codon:yes stop_codon:yes gene_type:complete